MKRSEDRADESNATELKPDGRGGLTARGGDVEKGKKKPAAAEADMEDEKKRKKPGAGDDGLSTTGRGRPTRAACQETTPPEP